MVLSDLEIWMEIQSGRLSFSPAIPFQNVGPSSIDLRLGDEITHFPNDDSDPPPPGLSTDTSIKLAEIQNVEEIIQRVGKTHNLSSQPFTLRPREFILAYTLESMEIPNYLAGRVEGRSSFARLGLTIHQTAPTVHATWKGPLRLEISNNGPTACVLSSGLTICQLILERLSSPASRALNSIFMP